MQVFAGTSNLTGALDITVTKAGADTTLGKVQSLIIQAEKTRIPIMRIIDRYVQMVYADDPDDRIYRRVFYQ